MLAYWHVYVGYLFIGMLVGMSKVHFFHCKKCLGVIGQKTPLNGHTSYTTNSSVDERWNECEGTRAYVVLVSSEAVREPKEKLLDELSLLLIKCRQYHKLAWAPSWNLLHFPLLEKSFSWGPDCRPELGSAAKFLVPVRHCQEHDFWPEASV